MERRGQYGPESTSKKTALKEIMKYVQVFTILTILLFGTGCNGPDKKGLANEKEHPIIIITYGNRYTHVECALQDKAGNLWFGTQVNGLYKYDGKSFSQFLVTNGLNSNDSQINEKYYNNIGHSDSRTFFLQARQ
jgi:hypothetical protein